MNKELLKQFFDQEHMRIEVYRFFKSELDKIALERVYDGEDTAGIKDAKIVMIRAQKELETMFTQKKTTHDTRRAE